MLTIILAICGLTLIGLAGIVFYSNYHSSVNRWLTAFIVSGLAWLLANLLANIASTPGSYLLYSRLAIVGAALIPLTFLMFCVRFADIRFRMRFLSFFLIFTPILFLISTTRTSLNIQSVDFQHQTFKPGVDYPILIGAILIYCILGLSILIREYNRSKQLRRQQLYYILAGFTLSVLPAFVVSGILPLFGNTEAVPYSAATVIFFPVFTSIAIIRHRLFDIRLAVARSLGYALSLVVLASLYGLIVFGFAKYVLHIDIPITLQILLSASTAVAGIAFPILKRRFDDLTDRVFFRDAYDPQELFDQLNKVLVSSLDIEFLMTQSVSILESALRPEFTAIILNSSEANQRIFSSRKLNLDRADLKRLQRSVANYHHKSVVVEQLEAKHELLKELMQKTGATVIMRLAQDLRRAEDGQGYIMIGGRKSGNPYSRSDINVLDIVSNELFIAIQNALHYEEIQKFNLTLQAKVDEATRKLRASNEKLKTLDETKDDFISMASHQLRTPLTSIKGYLSMVLEGDAGRISPTQRKMLSQAFVSSQRMVYLISDLLNVSRLRTGKFVIESAPTDLANMIQEELAQLVEAAASRGLELVYHKPKDFPLLMLDETKTRQVIMNFIDNAIYYTPSGGKIEVRLEDTPHTVELRVVDNGIGVPRGEQHHLFTKFYRAKNAQKARPDGTGLGLYMTKKVIVGEGGSIIFDSTEGKGSTFGFMLPKAKLAVPAGQAPAQVAKVAPKALVK